MMFLHGVTWFFGVVLSAIIITLIAKFYRSKRRKRLQKRKDNRVSIGFFHPYCNAGGGGERVLWCGLKALQSKYSNFRYIVYTGDTDATAEQILENVKSRFNITLAQDSLEFVFLNQRDWIESHHYPHLTLLCQSFGSIILSLEALRKFVPDIYIDTMGYAFTLPIFKVLGRSKVACYVHYPTISTDMLGRVAGRAEAHNNDTRVARSSVLTALKIIYYRLFARAYSWAGKYSDTIMVNSSWTQSHINSLWHSPSKTSKVFPPCDVDDFKRIPNDTRQRSSITRIVSIAQFRPEKDHILQLKAFAELKTRVSEEEWKAIRLVLIGGCRNIDDKCRVAHLKYLCSQMGLETNVEFKLNVPYEELKTHMGEGTIGLHTMWNEHFGIGVVECMAAGLIMVAHKSGGPMMDIIETLEPHRTGFLATTETEYAQTLLHVIRMSQDEKWEVQTRARASVDRFTEDKFRNDFLTALKNVLE